MVLVWGRGTILQERPAVADVIDLSQPPLKTKRKHVASRQLLTRQMLGSRSKTAQMYDAMVAAIEADLAGDLSTIEKSLIEGFVGCSIIVKHINARLIALDGKELDLAAYAMAVNAMTKIGHRLGLKRRQRQVIQPPSLNEYLSQKGGSS
jgi:hypothetical protein